MLPRIAIDLPPAGSRLDLAALFGPAHALPWLELGFGDGAHLAWQAARNPTIPMIGCEPFINGVAKLLRHVSDEALDRVRVFPEDGRLLLDALPDASIGRVFVLFPDPWPKARHHRRRLIGPRTLAALSRVMADGAELRLATDDADYLTWIMRHMRETAAFAWCASRADDWRHRPTDWPATRYEQKADAAGRVSTYLRYRRRHRA